MPEVLGEFGRAAIKNWYLWPEDVDAKVSSDAETSNCGE